MIAAYIIAEQRGLKIVPAKQLQVSSVGAIALVGSVSIFWYKGPSDQWVIKRFHEIYYESFTSD